MGAILAGVAVFVVEGVLLSSKLLCIGRRPEFADSNVWQGLVRFETRFLGVTRPLCGPRGAAPVERCLLQPQRRTSPQNSTPAAFTGMIKASSLNGPGVCPPNGTAGEHDTPGGAEPVH